MNGQSKYLIVNADDFGQSHEVNEGIIECYEKGVVTSTSLMVRWPAVSEAATYARAHPSLSIGLHVDLGEWRRAAGDWQPVYEVATLDDLHAVRSELASQLTKFRHLVGRDPSHLDSHQHVHLRDPLRPLFKEAALRLGVPVRHMTPQIRYCGEFYGQSAQGLASPEAVSVARLIELFETLPMGVTELACHPGLNVHLNTMYRDERGWEVRTLTDVRVREALDRLHIRLYSFRQFCEEFEITT